MAGNEPTGMGRYTKGAILGEGTFGVVFKATDTVVCRSVQGPRVAHWLTRSARVQTNQVVAMKKIRLGKYKEVRAHPRPPLVAGFSFSRTNTGPAPPALPPSTPTPALASAFLTPACLARA